MRRAIEELREVIATECSQSVAARTRALIDDQISCRIDELESFLQAQFPLPRSRSNLADSPMVFAAQRRTPQLLPQFPDDGDQTTTELFRLPASVVCASARSLASSAHSVSAASPQDPPIDFVPAASFNTPVFTTRCVTPNDAGGECMSLKHFWACKQSTAGTRLSALPSQNLLGTPHRDREGDMVDGIACRRVSFVEPQHGV